MKEETKKLFTAPWCVDIHAVDGIDGEPYVFDGVYNDKCELVCGNIQKHATSNRVTHLPELYDALMEACGEYCPNLKYDLNHCSNCGGEDCKAEKWVELLRKVKEGK